LSCLASRHTHLLLSVTSPYPSHFLSDLPPGHQPLMLQMLLLLYSALALHAAPPWPIAAAVETAHGNSFSPPGTGAEALAADDECAEMQDGSTCGLNALQLRGLSKASHSSDEAEGLGGVVQEDAAGGEEEEDASGGIAENSDGDEIAGDAGSEGSRRRSSSSYSSPRRRSYSSSPRRRSYSSSPRRRSMIFGPRRRSSSSGPRRRSMIFGPRRRSSSSTTRRRKPFFGPRRRSSSSGTRRRKPIISQRRRRTRPQVYHVYHHGAYDDLDDEPGYDGVGDSSRAPCMRRRRVECPTCPGKSCGGHHCDDFCRACNKQWLTMSQRRRGCRRRANMDRGRRRHPGESR